MPQLPIMVAVVDGETAVSRRNSSTRLRIDTLNMDINFRDLCSGILTAETIPIKENKLGVALVSGYSPTIMKMVLSGQTDPFECLIEQLNAERYDIIENLIKDLL